ncbi:MULTISPECIES: bifunctional DNA-formamidopyrimidine glycosylase/DNA-(apurinic or apyrimidinic site) lyase [Vibrio]|uniref:bifunctional DNA-formamidopyrimidine glycosylase/DNA-(apurinic or apyrimidinic site) lyase n=1 Tax=Vibrio TaxID=662 RepID=UPI000B5CF2CE|nr:MULTISPECIES: bifunctional DNA-formamidopyrimidine glycosylase/DNA-(apurinic or apyrimidinic site) lyase [Vibrio]HBV76707.1 bifunctional DNA-formamidopyrimidine glycosylase/DNA-(apurinic or apyrimidinic site) lyase [Vibrio sp.]
MPELPEVEVSRMGITPHLLNQTIQKIDVRQPKLRWPIPEEILSLQGQVIRQIRRRAKYLLIETDMGTAIIHLGMSGNLRILDQFIEPNKHDHVDLTLTNGKVLRYHDPRRFGAWLWCETGTEHDVMSHLGPEPLTDGFNAQYLFEKAQSRKIVTKQFIMDNKVVVGVGNIYASESLFGSKVHPKTLANQLTLKQITVLVDEIKKVLARAITQGGTTLKDFNQADGKPGYFAQELQVYGKAGKPCPICSELIQEEKIGQRNSFYCEGCQIKDGAK